MIGIHRILAVAASIVVLSASSLVRTNFNTGTTLLPGYLAQPSNGAVFLEFTRAGSRIDGSIELTHLPISPTQSGLQTKYGAVEGTIADSAITLQLGSAIAEQLEALEQVPYAGTIVPNSGTLSAYLQGRTLVLEVPLESGELAEVDFNPADVAQYNDAVTALSDPAVEICGDKPSYIRPNWMYLACADGNDIATDLHWISWNTKMAVAKGIETWNICEPSCAGSTTWDSTAATFTLTHAAQTSQGWLFESLIAQVTGPTPRRFMRRVTYRETPIGS
jgi:hypothetical protein